MQEARVPLLLIDAAVVYGLHRWEGQLKAEKARMDRDAAQQADVQKETDKRSKNQQRSAERAQRRAEDKKTQNNTGKQANFSIANPIQQPDKNKKQR